MIISKSKETVIDAPHDTIKTIEFLSKRIYIKC